MLRINLISSFRNLRKSKLNTAINLFGLATAFASSFLIYQYVHFEQSYDNYHDDFEHIYRIETTETTENSVTKTAYSFLGLGLFAKDEIPEIEAAFSTLIDLAAYSQVSRQLDNGQIRTVKLDNYHNVTSSIFDVLAFDTVEGTLEGALERVNTVVITRKLKNKLFEQGSTAIGERISVNNGGIRSFEIVAVVEDLPENSHLKVELMESMLQFDHDYPEIYASSMWTWMNRYNYLKVKPNTDIDRLTEKLNEFLRSRQGNESSDASNPILTLKPIADIHLNSNIANEHEVNGNQTSVNFLIVIGMLIVLIAFANYINLTASGNMARAKEVSVKKVMGSSKKLIIIQFLMESLIITGSAFVIATWLIILSEPFVLGYLKSYPDFYLLNNPTFWIISFPVALVLGVLAGLYPALVISNQKSVLVLKGKFTHSKKGILLYRTLTVLQFLMTSCLILFTFIVNRQMDYMLKQDLGVQIEQTLVLKGPPYTHEDPTLKFEGFRNNAINHSSILEVSASTSIPGTAGINRNIRLLSAGENDIFQISSLRSDHYYVDLFDLKMLAGHGYSKDIPGDLSQSLVINEKLSAMLGFDTPEAILGTQVIIANDTLSVIGVIANYRHSSLKEDYSPMAFLLGLSHAPYISVKFNTDNLPEMIDRLELAWEQQFPNILFDFFFEEDHFNQQYQRDQELGSIVNLFSVIAIIVACSGLFALSLYTATQRRKEIAIKKVLGAGSFRLFWNLAKNILTSILIAGLIASPLSYFFIKNWLESFSNRIDFGLPYLLIPIAMIIVLSLVAISYNLIKTVKVNPADILHRD